MFLFISFIIVILFCLYLKHRIQFGSVNFVSGEVKSGKTLFCVSRCINEIKKRRFLAFITNFFKKNKEPLPVLYSNIPLDTVYYKPLSLSIIERKEKIIYKSVVFIDEASLLADNMAFNNQLLNERITLFIKLFGHFSKGGIMFINSQDLKDVHYGIKRSVSNIYFIKKRIKLPFITIFKFSRFMSVIDDNIQIDDEIYTSICFNSTYKKYDCYTYSVLTDNLHCDLTKSKKADNLKSDYILSFRDFKSFENKEKSNE